MDEHIGDRAYIKAHPHVAYTYLTYTGCLCFLGCLGNICVLLAFAVNKNLRSVRNVFLVNLALADLVITAIGHPFAITGKLVNSLRPSDAI